MPNLPPKIPNSTSTPHHFPQHNNDFRSFSSRQSLHRRSISDSTAFLDTPVMTTQSLLSSTAPLSNSNISFDGFDDEEKFRSMLSDEIHSNNEDDQPTSSDHNSIEKLEAATNDDPKHFLRNEPKQEAQIRQCDDNAAAINISNDRVTDPKRVKRILANRQSARRSRVRKLQYISELERSVTQLQAEVSMLSPRVAFLDQQRLLLNVDNSALKQRIATLSQDKIFKDAHEDALKREIERLGQLYHRQKSQRMECNESSPIVTKEQPTSSGDQKHKLLYL
ncbi:basic leucine zipper 61-like [Benincasa hispida]|uniref:basic leucine zipper 61-like n=1 Tax=Benincasa hispida TaxID=102211 RepID=UPI001902A1A6|nr:basic leucine zipper 61-like [Benincasa hispida]